MVARKKFSYPSGETLIFDKEIGVHDLASRTTTTSPEFYILRIVGTADSERIDALLFKC